MPPTPVTISLRPAQAGTGKPRFGTLSTVTLAPRAPAPPQRTDTITPLTANQKRKAHLAMPMPTSEHLSHTMVAQNVAIVARCLAHVSPPSPPLSARKRTSHQATPTASPAPSGPIPSHPYSRATDLANTRSTVPSPQELARAERAEEEKARQKKENAAAARAAAALARRRKALRSGRGSRTPSASVTPATMIPPIQRAVAKERARSAEAAAARLYGDELTLPTMELEDGAAPVSRSLKRTRSNGLGNVTPSGAAAVAIASPLRTVSMAEDEKEGVKISPGSEVTNGDETAPQRKRSRLAESLPARAPSTRRGASTSPAGSTTSLPDTTSSPHKAAARTDPSLSPTEPTSASMRRVVSATDRTATRTIRTGSATPRNASVGPESMRERSRRDTQPPSHMRDFTTA